MWKKADAPICLTLAAGLAGMPLAPVRANEVFQLTPTLTLEGASFVQSESWYGRSRHNLGLTSDDWVEGAVTPGLDAVLRLGDFGFAYGRVSGVGAYSYGTDAAGSAVPDIGSGDFLLEDAVIGWRTSRDPIELGETGFELSYGRQRYQAGSGFLFWSGATSGGNRGAYWIAPRKAFAETGLVRLRKGGFGIDVVYLSPNDDPFSNTKLAGTTIDYRIEDVGTVGGGYYNIFESDIETRDGMSVYDIRFDLEPWEGLRLAGEYVYEENGSRLSASGYYGEIGWTFEDQPWSPYLSYRYASFQGDDPSTGANEGFDPLFYSNSDWGSWIQGEILGEYVLFNNDLVTHTIRLTGTPSDAVTLNLLYYYFQVPEPDALGIRSEDFAQEIDLVADWTITDYASVSTVTAVSLPMDGAEEYTGGDDPWYYGMIYLNLTF
jgi:hypothetical protein